MGQAGPSTQVTLPMLPFRLTTNARRIGDAARVAADDPSGADHGDVTTVTIRVLERLPVRKFEKVADRGHESIACSRSRPSAISSSSISISAMISSGVRCSTSSVDNLLVAVQRQVVALGDDVRLGHEERLRGARPLGLGVPVPPAGERVGQVIVGNGVALVVQREAVRLHVVEPDVVGASGVGPGEEQDRGRHPCIGTEHSRGQFDHGVELLVLDQGAARSLWALDEPNSTPSGTITAALPPAFSSFRNRATNSSSFFFVLTMRCRSLAVAS